MGANASEQALWIPNTTINNFSVLFKAEGPQKKKRIAPRVVTGRTVTKGGGREGRPGETPEGRGSRVLKGEAA